MRWEESLAMEAYAKPFIFSGELEEKVVKHIGKDRLDRSVVAGGSRGLDLSKTKYFREKLK